MVVSLVLLVIGAFLLLKGADLLVEGGVGIAMRKGISPLVVGLTVVFRRLADEAAPAGAAPARTAAAGSEAS